jgi:antitoxin CptB
MSGPAQAHRKRLYFRCHHTGMKENDILLGRFADHELQSLTDDDVAWLEDFLMNNNDLDIYNWISGREPVPPEQDHPVMRLLRASAGAA